MTTDLLDRKQNTKLDENTQSPWNEVLEATARNAPESDASQSPGDNLRRAREKAGYSCEKVGNALKIPASYIEAIDHCQFDKMPGLMFVRGYIRSYARHVELNPDVLIADFDRFIGQDGTDTPRLSAGRDVEIRRHVSPLISIGGVVCVVSILIVVAFSYYNRDFSSHGDAPLVSEAEEPALTIDNTEPAFAPLVMDHPELPESEVESEVGAVSGDSEFTEPVLPEEHMNKVIPEETSTPVEPVVTEVVEPQPAAPAIVQLTIDFIEDCWIQVRDMDGKNLFTEVQKAGSSLNLDVPPNIQVRFGNVPGVKTVMFAGEPVEVKMPAPGRKVASLILGSADAG